MQQNKINAEFGMHPASVGLTAEIRENILKILKKKIVDRKSCDDVDQVVLMWLDMMRDQIIPISDVLVRQKALEFSKSLGYTSFDASKTWFERFKKRHSARFKIMCRESGNALDRLRLEVKRGSVSEDEGIQDRTPSPIQKNCDMSKS